MDQERLKAILESLFFAAGEPVSLGRIAAVLDSVPKEEIKTALTALRADYERGGRGLVLEHVAGGYQLRTRKEFAPQVRKLLAAKPPRLSRPLLETLALVAYRQPITRPEIDQFRGVDSGGVLETLLERRLVRIAGRKEAPGRPILYATTPEFLEVFGLRDLDSLPDLEELKEIDRAASEAESAPVEMLTESAEVASRDASSAPPLTAAQTGSEPDAGEAESMARTGCQADPHREPAPESSLSANSPADESPHGPQTHPPSQGTDTADTDTTGRSEGNDS